MDVKEVCALFNRHLGPFPKPLESADQSVQLHSTEKLKAKQIVHTIIPSKCLSWYEDALLFGLCPHSAVAGRTDQETSALRNRLTGCLAPA